VVHWNTRFLEGIEYYGVDECNGGGEYECKHE